MSQTHLSPLGAGHSHESTASAGSAGKTGKAGAAHRLSPEMRHCIEECRHCAETCLSMAATHCLETGGPHVEPVHFRTMLDCAEICQTSANFLLRNSPLHVHTCRACAEVCEACAKSCEAVGDMDECVETCRRCAESCRRMAAMASA